MNYFSEALTIGIVLVLLFGSIAFYLYTRIQQTEQKNSLLESILLDLKMNAEMKSYSELPADDEVVSIPIPPSSSAGRADDYTAGYTPFEPVAVTKETEEEHSVAVDVHDAEQYSSVIDDAVNEITELSESIDTGVEEIQVTTMDQMDLYDEMKLKELHELARSRGIPGATTMKKQAAIEALRAYDRASTAFKPGSSSIADHSEILSSE